MQFTPQELSKSVPLKVNKPIQQRPFLPVHPPMFSLAPLSSGGFIYNFPLLPHTQPACATQVQTPMSFVPIPSSPSPVGSPVGTPDFLTREPSREEKLERYRQKRTKRNFVRSVDSARSERASSRSRDTSGQFVPEKNSQKKVKGDLEEMKSLLELSQKESLLLQQRLCAVERELERLKQKADDADASKAQLEKELEDQQRINKNLMDSMLWSTVPSNEIFSTIRPGNAISEAFKETINFSDIELNVTDSPFLTQARVEDTEFEKRWDEMTLFGSSRS